MPKEIFDQDRPQPRSAKARGLAAAFAGCEEWTLAPPSPRRSTLDVAPWLSSPSRIADRTAYDSGQERRAA
jgi:hypothetical protein